MREDQYPTRRGQRNWLPVLLLFLALLFAWGVYSNNIGGGDVGTQIEQQFGIGGAPQAPQQPSTVPSPTITQQPTPTETIDLSPTIDETLEDITPADTEDTIQE